MRREYAYAMPRRHGWRLGNLVTNPINFPGGSLVY